MSSEEAPKPEDQPIRHGDIIQVLEGECLGMIGIATGDPTPQSRITFKHFDITIGWGIREAKVAKIGRATIMPDGSPVEP